MVAPHREEPEAVVDRLPEMLMAARNGSDSDVGRLIESTRRYLLLVANRSLDSGLQPKVAPSDLVQETVIEAHRDFGKFEGTSEAEFFAWIRKILLHRATAARRRYRGTAKRNIAQERPLASPSRVIGPDQTPSAFAMAKENEIHLADTLEKLPMDYRQVIELRNLERLSFAEVGQRLGRSEDAAGKLWFRAIEKLRDELTASEGPGPSFPR